MEIYTNQTAVQLDMSTGAGFGMSCPTSLERGRAFAATKGHVGHDIADVTAATVIPGSLAWSSPI